MILTFAFAFGLGLQLAGALITWREVADAAHRWHERFSPRRGRVHELEFNDNIGVQETVTITAEAEVEGREPTIEERLEILQKAMDAGFQDVRRSIEHLERTFPTEARAAAGDVEARLQPQITDVLAYLAGQGQRKRWRPWWLGPVLVGVGLLITGIVTIVDLAQP